MSSKTLEAGISVPSRPHYPPSFSHTVFETLIVRYFSLICPYSATISIDRLRLTVFSKSLSKFFLLVNHFISPFDRTFLYLPHLLFTHYEQQNKTPDLPVYHLIALIVVLVLAPAAVFAVAGMLVLPYSSSASSRVQSKQSWIGRARQAQVIFVACCVLAVVCVMPKGDMANGDGSLAGIFVSLLFQLAIAGFVNACVLQCAINGGQRRTSACLPWHFIHTTLLVGLLLAAKTRYFFHTVSSVLSFCGLPVMDAPLPSLATGPISGELSLSSWSRLKSSFEKLFVSSAEDVLFAWDDMGAVASDEQLKHPIPHTLVRLLCVRGFLLLVPRSWFGIPAVAFSRMKGVEVEVVGGDAPVGKPIRALRSIFGSGDLTWQSDEAEPDGGDETLAGTRDILLGKEKAELYDSASTGGGRGDVKKGRWVLKADYGLYALSFVVPLYATTLITWLAAPLQHVIALARRLVKSSGTIVAVARFMWTLGWVWAESGRAEAREMVRSGYEENRMEVWVWGLYGVTIMVGVSSIAIYERFVSKKRAA